MSSDDNRVILGPGQSTDLSRVLVCRTTQGDDRGLPNTVDISKPCSVEMVASSSKTVIADSIIESSIELRVHLSAAHDVGHQQAEIIARWPDGKQKRHLIHWEVSNTLFVSPSAISVRAASKPVKSIISLMSTTAPFTILGVDGSCVLDVAADSDVPALRHSVQFTVDPKDLSALQAKDIRIRTDHPEHKSVVITVLVTS